MFRFLRVFAILLVSLFTQIGSNSAFAIETTCPKGYTTYGSTDGNCVICPRGYYCPDTSPLAFPCGLGKYNANIGATSSTDCKACPSISSSDASAGYSYANSAAPGVGFCYITKTYGENCTAGQRVLYPKAMTQLNGNISYLWTDGVFPADTSDEFANIAFKAKAGYYVDGTTCVACPAGTYQGTNGSTAKSCTPCANWTYNPNTGQSACTACSTTIPTNYTKVDSTGTGWTSESSCVIVSNSLGSSTSGCESATTYFKQVNGSWKISTAAPYESTVSAKPGYEFNGNYSNYYPTCYACPEGSTSRGDSNKCGYKFELDANGGTWNNATANNEAKINFLLAEESGDKFVNATYVLNGETYTQFITSNDYPDFVPSFNIMRLPTLTNYTFTGFYTATSGGIQMIDANGYLTSNFTNASLSSLEDYYTFYAQYEKATYDIEIDLNGGSSDEQYEHSGITAIRQTYDESVEFYVEEFGGWMNAIDIKNNAYSVVPPAGRTGYRFNGFWTAASGGTQLVDANGYITTAFTNKYFTKNSTIYAQYTPATYNIGYDLNGGTNYAGAPITYTYGVGATINGTPTRTGYTFDGWCNSDGTNCAKTKEISKTESGNVFFVAAWTPKTIKVTLDNQGATNAGTKEYYYQYNTKNACYYYTTSALRTCINGNSGDTITIPTKTGYTFGGYYTGQNGSGTPYVNANGVTTGNLYTKSTSDITLYAQWTPNKITVNLITTIGSGGQSKIYVKYDDAAYRTESYTNKMTTSQNPITIPYENDVTVFMGYYTEPDGAGIQMIAQNGYITNKFSPTYSATNYNLYAYWTTQDINDTCPDGYTAPVGATSSSECSIQCAPGYGVIRAGEPCEPLEGLVGPYYFTGGKVYNGEISALHVCPFWSTKDPLAMDTEYNPGGTQLYGAEIEEGLRSSATNTCVATSEMFTYGAQVIDVSDEKYYNGNTIMNIHIENPGAAPLYKVDLYYKDEFGREFKVPEFDAESDEWVQSYTEVERFINLSEIQTYYGDEAFNLFRKNNNYISEFSYGDQWLTIPITGNYNFSRIVLHMSPAYDFPLYIHVDYTDDTSESVVYDFYPNDTPISYDYMSLSFPLTTYSIADENMDYYRQCQPGFYQPGYNYYPGMDTECLMAEPGYYAPEYAMAAPWACPNGTFQSEWGSENCNQIDQGYYGTNCAEGDMACSEEVECESEFWCSYGYKYECDIGYQDDTTTGKYEASQCKMLVPAGHYVANSKDRITSQCSAGTYATEQMVRWGDTTKCNICGDNQYSDEGAGSCSACDTEKKYYNSGTNASDHDGIESCKTTCSAGQRVVSAGGQCTSPAGNWFTSAAQDVNYGSISAVDYCMTGYTSNSTTASAHDSSTDCTTTISGKYIEQNTIPASKIKIVGIPSGTTSNFMLNEIQAFESHDGTGTNLLAGKNCSVGANCAGATDGNFSLPAGQRPTASADGEFVFELGGGYEIGSIKFNTYTPIFDSLGIYVLGGVYGEWIPVFYEENYTKVGVSTPTMVVLNGEPIDCDSGKYQDATTVALGNTSTCSSCPTDASSRTESSNAGSKTSSACFVTCPPKTVKNSISTSTVNATVYYDNNNQTYPACTYNVTCNAGYSAQDNNTSNPMCTANCNAITLDANGGTSGVITTVYKKTDDTTNVYSDNQCTTTLNGIIGSQIKPTRDGYTSLGFYGEQYESITGVQEQISTENSKLYLISTKNYVASDEFKKLNVTAPMTIYAAWAKNCPETVPNGSCQLDGVVMGEVVYTTSCDTGYTISGNGTANPICTANTYTCQSGQYLDGTTCKPCDAGYYCPSESQTYTYNGEIQGRTDCPAGSYCPAESTKPMACTGLGGGLYANSNEKSTKPEDCYITTTAGYYIANSDDTTETACYLSAKYCPSTTLNWPNTGGTANCPSHMDKSVWRTEFPDYLYDAEIYYTETTTVRHASSIERCRILYRMTSQYGDEYQYAWYNPETEKYDIDATWGYASIVPGYYLAGPSACGGYAYYHEIHECKPNSYCPGKERVICDDSNKAEVHTETFGLEPCPETYPNSVGGTDATSINVCNVTLNAGEFVETAGNGASTCPAGAYCVGGETIYYDKTGGIDVCASNTYSDAGASACSECDTTNGYTNSGTTFASHANASSCVTTCAAGTYVKDAKSACTAVDISGKYMGEHNVAYGSTSTLETCPVGASGSDNGRETDTDCYYTCPAQTTPNGDVTATNANEYYNGTTYPTCTYTTTCDTGYELNADGTACVARVFKITLSPNTDDTLVTRGTEYVYVRYGDGMYLDAELTKKMTIDGTENVIEIPTRNGYTITYGSGFKLEPNQQLDSNPFIISGHTKTIAEDFDPTMFTSDTTVYAVWHPISYNITLDSGSDITNNPTTTLYSTYNFHVYRDAPIDPYIMTETSNPVTIPTRDGYVFDGFYTEQNGMGDLLVGPNGYITSTLTSTYINSPNADDDITFYAKWTAATCDIENGTGTPSVSDNTVTCTIKCNTGYGHDTGTVTGSKNSATVSSACKANEYTVKYSCGDGEGTAPASDTAIYDAAYNTRSNINCAKTGYDFVGWTVDETDFAYGTKWTYTTDKTFVAKYSLKQPGTIELQLNDGTNNTRTVTCTVVNADTTSFGDATRTGYTFDGWYYEDKKYTTPTADMCANGATLSAEWTAHTYTVKYDANGGDGAMANSSHTYDVAKALTANTFTRTGYTFAGWATSNGNEKYNNGATVKNLTAENGATVTLYAVWDANTTKISFNANGGTGGQSDTVTATYDSAMPTISTTNPTKTACKFTGWYDTNNIMYYTSAGASAKSWDKTDANAILYAGWDCFSASATSVTLTYNGTAQECSANSANIDIKGINDYTITYGSTNNGTFNTQIPTLTTVDDRTVFFKVSAANYGDYIGSYTCEMKPATMTVQSSNKTMTYTGAAQSCDNVTVQKPTEGYSIQYGTSAGSYTDSVPQITDVGNITVYYRVTGDNFNEQYGNYECTVIPNSTMEPTSSDDTKTYDGTPLVCDGNIANIPNGTTITYGFVDGTYNLDTAPTITNVADSKTIYYQATNKNYSSKTGHFVCEVTQATNPMSLDKTSGTLTMSGTDTIIASNAQGSISAKSSNTDVVTVTVSGSTITVTAKSAGKATITVTASGNENYESASKEYTVNVCTPCSADTGATCDLSVVDNTCTYTTECKTGYENIQNSGAYNPSCSAKKYTVEYYCDDNANTALIFDTAIYDSDYSLQTNTCTKTGYKFTGWSDGTEIYDEGYTFEPWRYTTDKTYTAQWAQDIITCAAGTYYAGSDIKCSPCESGYYCTGGEFTIGNGTLGGIKKCPTEYPNTENDTFATKITDCFSDTKQRAWTGSRVNGATPTNCSDVTWNSCSVDDCEYTAYANEDGTGDGKHKTGCESNNAPCTMTVKSVTATSGYYVSGTSCIACSDLANGLYPNSDADNTGGTSACYTNEISGAVIATANASSTTKCANWEYKESHTVKYGDTSSCNACPDLTDGWTKYDSNGSGWTSFTQCVQKQTPMNCKSGTVKQTAIDATTWGATTLDITLIANAGFYASDTALYCSQCPDNGNSDTGATEITSCYNYQDCTLGSGSGKKQCYYDDDDYTNCGICNVSDCQPGYELKGGACAECPAGTYSAMGTECVVCNDNTYSYAHASSCNACLTERGYGNQGSDAISHAGEESCVTTCNAGTYVSAIGGKCENVGAGFWGKGGIVNQTQTSERHACEDGLTTIGYGYGANEAGDCGRILHAGAYTIYLRSEQATNPSLRAYVDGKTLFGNMSTSQTSGGLKVKYNDTIYSVVNE